MSHQTCENESDSSNAAFLQYIIISFDTYLPRILIMSSSSSSSETTDDGAIIELRLLQLIPPTGKSEAKMKSSEIYEKWNDTNITIPTTIF